LIAIHGYGGGRHAVESVVFPVRRWVKRGWDVFLFVQPFHGPRRAPGDKLRFPSNLPQVTIEGFRQAVADLRNLVHHLRHGDTQHVGVVGMSLGGYTASLLATVDADLDLVAPFIPLCSLPLYMRDHGRFGGTEAQRDQQQAALVRVLSAISPLWRPGLVPASRMVVGGARHDGVNRIHHAQKLAAHFGCPMLQIPGAHLVQWGRRAYWREAERILDSA
jgi:pimeloyl-ACP methyl ester carboxylesterase